MLMKIWSILNYNILIDDCIWEQIMCDSDLSDSTFQNGFCVQRSPDCDVIEFVIVPPVGPRLSSQTKDAVVLEETIKETIVVEKDIRKKPVSITKKMTSKTKSKTKR